MQQSKISEIAELLKIQHTKMKRYAREFLPPDGKATIQSGYARILNEEEAFTVFLGAHLVSDLWFVVHDAKKILSDLDEWLKTRGLFPGHAKTTGGDELCVKSYKIIITPTDVPGYFLYEAIGSINKNQSERIYSDEEYQNIRIWELEYVSLPIKPAERKGSFQLDDYNVRILRISWLYEFFKRKVEGKTVDAKQFIMQRVKGKSKKNGTPTQES